MRKILEFLKKVKPCYIVIAILVVALIFTQQCKRSVDSDSTGHFWNWDFHSTTTVDTVHDTVRIVSTVYVPVPGETIYNDPPIDLDCQAMAIDYYASRYYNDTLKNDTSALIIIKDVVSQNILAQRQWEFINYRPTAIYNTVNTITYDTCPECKKWNIGIGGMIGGYTDKFGAGPSIVVTTNKKASYSASYDVIQKIGYFGIYWNVR